MRLLILNSFLGAVLAFLIIYLVLGEIGLSDVVAAALGAFVAVIFVSVRQGKRC